jgi:hypothetical protein
MPDAKGTRISPYDIRRTTENLHRTAGEIGDDFLQYLFEMALLYLDSHVRGGRDLRVEVPEADASRIARAAKLLNDKASGA